MANEWDDWAESWESNESTGLYAENAFQQLMGSVDLNNKEVLDFGCGTGLLSQKMSPLAKNIVALDSSEAMIEQLDKKELPNVEPVVDSLTRGLVAQHPAFRKQFDVVVASSVCGFLKSFSEAVDIIYAILDNGGTFIHFDWLNEHGEEENGLAENKIKQVLTSVGFETVSVSEPFSIAIEGGSKKVIMGLARKSDSM